MVGVYGSQFNAKSTCLHAQQMRKLLVFIQQIIGEKLAKTLKKRDFRRTSSSFTYSGVLFLATFLANGFVSCKFARKKLLLTTPKKTLRPKVFRFQI